MNEDLTYLFSPVCLLLWLGITVILSIATSWFRAHRAAQIGLRESLAYL
jgi:hypothetical protein